MSELKPCPFCGGEAELKQYQSGDWQVICYHADGCIMCESDLDNCYWENVQILTRQWNTRHERTCHNEYGLKNGVPLKFRCSECGDVWQKPSVDEFNFCPTCGAKVVDE